ncbi:hypothetical protein J1N35_002376 [Gossypium stocksii]|uniref:Kinesin motor domain-containing protein n=1 Tax=Gossypium stocksii TaxID=47602 RepID=A0A9D4ANE7_9ROSI|nr:hypothetical protein J1N35_002376 [Gossypium stocksii]
MSFTISRKYCFHSLDDLNIQRAYSKGKMMMRFSLQKVKNLPTLRPQVLASASPRSSTATESSFNHSNPSRVPNLIGGAFVDSKSTSTIDVINPDKLAKHITTEQGKTLKDAHGDSREEKNGDEDVTLFQLNLIDLAGSESSKAETTGLWRKEGSYINKSLLTLGTIISKLTDGKATHIPYRDSKLTRLLQSYLSGRGRISLTCIVTPASSNSEETHNTLKFAHRSKHVEIKASQNKIMDEKLLIIKYQNEISSLKHELEQLRQGMMERPYTAATTQDDLVNLKLQLSGKWQRRVLGLPKMSLKIGYSMILDVEKKGLITPEKVVSSPTVLDTETSSAANAHQTVAESLEHNNNWSFGAVDANGWEISTNAESYNGWGSMDGNIQS